MNNDENNIPSWSDSVNRMLKAITSNLKSLTIDSETLLKPVVEMSKQLASSISALFELPSTDFFNDLRKNIKVFSDNILIERLQLMGSLEWCCIDKRIDLSKWYKSEDMKDCALSEIVIDKLRKQDCSSYEIDKFIGRFFTKDVISCIEEETIQFLDDEDFQKLKRAMIDFRGRRYFEAAVVLTGLIDAQSIKQELFDISKGKYHEDNKNKNNIPNISQGWRAFHIVFRNNFSQYFNDEHFNGDGKKATREKGMKEFLDGIKGNIPDDDTIVSIVALSLCLLNFFDDSEWKNYPNNKPVGINRHWLMHGMYNIDDITRYDCIKLLLMLNQISQLYSKLKSGDL